MRPNLILVTVECWRADHFGVLTPNVVEFSRESTVFTEAQTCGGWTRISMTALMSSAYASMHGGPDVALGTPARRTLAECLLENGYWTGGFPGNPVCGTIGGFHRGFARYGEPNRKPPLPSGAPTDWKTEWPRLLEMGIPPRDTRSTVDARTLTDVGLRFLRSQPSGQPWFLWLHYLDPHWPCQMVTKPSTTEELREAWEDVIVHREKVIPSHGTFDPGEKARERWIQRYRECLSGTDREIGRLLDELRKRGDWDRTVAAITADHGEELFERGTWHHSWNQLHREGVHVPLIVRVPGNAPRSVDVPVGLIDLAPTFLEYADIATPGTMMGNSLRPAIEGKPWQARPVFTEMMGHDDSSSYRLAIRDGEWRYIYDFDYPRESKLFRVSEDPGETVNLRDMNPAEFRRFEQMRLAHVTLGLVDLMERTNERPIAGAGRVAADASADDSDMGGNEILREQMEALGYL